MPSERSAGILLHPTSLPSTGGIGDLGPAAYAFADFLASARQGVWQVLPLSSPGLGDSPYSAISAFAGNPLLISLERLVQGGWLAAETLQSRPEPVGRVNFDLVKGYKLPLLHQAAQNFLQTDSAERQHFEGFKQQNSWWLEDFVLFNVLRRVHHGLAWTDWPRPLARREPQGMHQFGMSYKNELEVERAIQFLFFEQWRALRSYCAQRGIRMVGDVAIFVNYDSVDVWRNPELFHLDNDLKPTIVAGVPPDAFSETGQRWGNPLYRWDVLRLREYDWWVRRLSWALKEFDLVRLDHFRGFESYWEIPAAEPTAARGRWVKGPQDDFFHVLRAHFGGLPFIAEDLGLITPEVHALRERVGVPGMKVLQFGFSGPGARIYLPHNFTADCVVYTGTHDNDTTIGWWESGATQQEKDNATAYLGPMADGVHWAFIRAAYSSVAGLAIVPLQDVLGLGSDGRMNVPSESKGNWGWRYTPDALTGELAHKLASLAQGTDRAPAAQAGTAKPDEPKA